MKILILSEHVASDPGRFTFFNVDRKHQYLKMPIKRYFKKQNKLCYFLNILFTALRLRFEYRKLDVDLIISFNPRIGFFIGIINRLTRCKLKHVVWGFNIQKPYVGFLRWISLLAFKNVDCFVTYSNHESALYSNMLGIEPKRFYFKHLSGPYLEDVRYLNLIRKKQDYIVSAGFSGRNYLFLSEVSKKLPDISFIVLTYPWATKNLSFGSNVEIISNISELEYCQYIANGKLFFLPISNKLTANGHIAIVQTMSLGTPLLTNITEGTKDYLCPDVNCVVYEDGAIDSTVATIRQLWSDNNRLIRLAQNGAEFAKEHFSINNDICVIDDLLVKLKGYF